MSLSLSEYKTAIKTKDDVGSLVCSLCVEYYIRRVVCSRDSEPNDKDWNERYALFPSYLFPFSHSHIASASPLLNSPYNNLLS